MGKGGDRCAGAPRALGQRWCPAEARWSTSCQPRALGEAFLGPATPRTPSRWRALPMFTFRPTSSAAVLSPRQG